MAYSDKYTIQMRDQEFVGEDRVLMQELRRRMPDVSKGLDWDTVLSELGDSGASVGGLEDAREALLHQMAEITGDSHNQKHIKRRVEEERSYKPYINQPNDTVVELFALQMIEQAVYSAQYRLKEVEPYVNKYNKDIRFRIGYIFKQLERWIYEMEIMYTYIRDDARRDKPAYNVYKNLIYYSHLVKKNFDITYTIYHLLKLHADFVKKVEKMKEKGPGEEGYEKPDPRDIDMTDPAMLNYAKDMMPDKNRRRRSSITLG